MIVIGNEKRHVSNRSLLGGSIYAGAAIGLGAIANILVGGLFGAFIFTIGIITVCYFNLDLYTGRICYPRRYSISNYIMIYCCNFVGAAATAGLIRCTKYGRQIMLAATEIMLHKTEDLWISLCILGFFCNCCIFIAVEVFRTHVGVERVVIIILAIMTFVLCGFEHSIANFAYLIMSNEEVLDFWKVIKVIVCVTAGNTIGGLTMSLGISGYHHHTYR